MEQADNERAVAKLKIMRLIEKKRRARYERRYTKKATPVTKAS